LAIAMARSRRAFEWLQRCRTLVEPVRGEAALVQGAGRAGVRRPHGGLIARFSTEPGTAGTATSWSARCWLGMVLTRMRGRRRGRERAPAASQRSPLPGAGPGRRRGCDRQPSSLQRIHPLTDQWRAILDRRDYGGSPRPSVPCFKKPANGSPPSAAGGWKRLAAWPWLLASPRFRRTPDSSARPYAISCGTR